MNTIAGILTFLVLVGLLCVALLVVIDQVKRLK